MSKTASAPSIRNELAGDHVVRDFELTATALDVRDPAGLTAADVTWIPAIVPGGVHESLIAAGRIEHPFRGEHDLDLRWIEERAWWFRAAVELPADLATGDRTLLVLDGVDTVASIWIDESLAARSANQFVPVEIDLTSLAGGTHDLLVCFRPPLEGLPEPERARRMMDRVKTFFDAATDRGEGSEVEPATGLQALNLASTLRRKAQFSWGWDFAPRVPSIGLTGPVRLRRLRGSRFVDHHFHTMSLDLAAKTAEVAFDVEVETVSGPLPTTVDVTLVSPRGDRTMETVALRDGRVSGVLRVDAVCPWWTHDLGEPDLYVARLEARAESGATIAETDLRIGVRTIELDRRSDETEGGQRFTFVLNGVPLFARGANWVPPSMLIGSVTAADRESLVRLTRDARMTMLRVWGGGVYEDASFYDACDRLGVLVWQDFMFACIDYPADDDVLREEVRREAAYQVKRLRHHPSLAIWAGNNEVHAMHQMAWGDLEPGPWGHEFFHGVLPDAIAEHAPGTLYWPGSPWASPEIEVPVNGTRDGDRHAWEVWHGADLGAGGPSEFASQGEAMHFSRYAYDTGRFISEFGLHAAPEFATLDRWAGPGRLTPDAPVLGNALLSHRNRDSPRSKGLALLAVETGEPTSIGQYVAFSQAVQAEGLKFGIEHYRRRQPHTSGTLLWQLNEPWPGVTWSIIDHDQVAKPAYYFVQRAYAPVLASFVERDEHLELWITNSGQEPVEDEAVIEVSTFGGDRLGEFRVPVEVGALGSRRVWRGRSAEYGAGPERYAWVSSARGSFEDNRLFFGRLRDLPLADAELDVDIRSTGAGTARVRVLSRGYSYLTRVLAPAPHVTFSTNAVDLRDGTSLTIDVRGLPADFDPTRLEVRSFADDLGAGNERR
ncbi:MAG: beta-mannosidase [Amycolatopsis sp.]|uniref:glycoside hydrolase family 2 protein n=1 Tax=Amycolatopsis sp. TaxID=37632 RepID=UPI00262D507D|nr:hypothetical protein [Amycolatopsis sp.]MCU1680894.1 beta-mannosidase [Amycolatopsis sp.]